MPAKPASRKNAEDRLHGPGLIFFARLLADLGRIRPDPARSRRHRPLAGLRRPGRRCPSRTRRREGFENRIAEILADELKLPLHYFWSPQGPGFVRNTLGTGLCDVILAAAVGSDIVDHTNAYYASTYVLVTKKGSPLDGIDQLEDPRLKGRRLGVIAATPPADHLLDLGLTDNAKTYPLLVDRRYASPAEDAIKDVEVGRHRRRHSVGADRRLFCQARPRRRCRPRPLQEDTRPLFQLPHRLRRQAQRTRLEAPSQRHRSAIGRRIWTPCSKAMTSPCCRSLQRPPRSAPLP